MVCSRVLSHLIHKSVMASHLPSQWQTAVINPVPKVSGPSQPADYRPISVIPILSRMVERRIVHKHLYPALRQYPIAENIKDPFAFRPTGSTTAAIIDLLQQTSNMLLNNDFVVIVSTDFSKAFDTVSHQAMFDKMGSLDLPDEIYNWMVSYYSNRSHVTRCHCFYMFKPSESSLDHFVWLHSACLMSSSLFLRIPETPAIFRCQLISDVGILSVSCFRIAQHSDPYRKIGSMSSSRIIMLISLFFG